MTATVKVLSVTVARLAAQPRLTEAGRQPAASVAQIKMSPKKFFVVVIVPVVVKDLCSSEGKVGRPTSLWELGPTIFL